MEQPVINLLSTYVPMVQRYKSQFLSLNTLLSKTTLTGKISSLDIAENLFDYMEKTQEKFENLQDELINTIMEQNFLNAYEEAHTSSKVIADLLSVSFQNYHENVLSLSNNKYFLESCVEYTTTENKEEKKALFERILKILHTFDKNCQKIYKNILLFKNDGELLQHVVGTQEINRKIKLSAVLDCNNVESYAEFYQRVDFYSRKDESHQETKELFFVIPLRTRKEMVAPLVLVLVANVQKVVKSIMEKFPYRLPQGNLLVIDKKDCIFFSDNERTFALGKNIILTKYEEYTFLENRSKSCMVGIEKIRGLEYLNSAMQDFRVCRVVPLYAAFDIKRQPNHEIAQELLEDSLLITEKLYQVIAEGENINEELGDVVINGEIIASKSHSYALNPILNNIRILSEEMNTLCIQSTGELQKGIYNALFNIVEHYAKYFAVATDMMLEKVIRDAIQTSARRVFLEYLKHFKEATPEEDTEIKARLNALQQSFKFFYNVALFDKEGNILQNALDNSINHHKINSVRISSADVVVSNFEATPLYNDKPTFIINVYIKESSRSVGGLAFVIDFAKIQEFLGEVLSNNSAIVSEKNDMFGVIFDSDKNILLTTKEDFSFDTFMQNEELEFKNFKKMSKIIKIGSRYYLVSSDVCNSQQSVFSAHTRKTLSAMIFVLVKEEKDEEY